MDLNEARRQIIAAARNPRGRKVRKWTREIPNDWRPQTVENPESGFPFAEAGGWEFIADQLEAGVLLEVIELHHPPGRQGFVIKAKGRAGRPEIYIKLELDQGKVWGRSFHSSEG